MNDSKSFGKLIREKRKLNRYSIDQLAVLLGMSRTNLGLIERGKQKIFLNQAIKISNILCFNISLFDESQTQKITTAKDSINIIENELLNLKRTIAKEV